MLGTILIIVLVLFLFGAIPIWDHSREWGYAPGGTITVALLIVLLLVVTGHL